MLDFKDRLKTVSCVKLRSVLITRAVREKGKEQKREGKKKSKKNPSSTNVPHYSRVILERVLAGELRGRQRDKDSQSPKVTVA